MRRIVRVLMGLAWEFLIQLVVVAVASFLATRSYINFAKDRILDIPNERSSHSIPVPRGGGLAVCLCFLALTLGYAPEFSPSVFWIYLSTLLVAGIGLIDDLKGLGVKIRLSVQLFFALVVFYFTLDSSLYFIGVAILETWWLKLPLVILFCLWMINLYNFMDGIDGILAVQAIFALLATSFLLGEPNPFLILFSVIFFSFLIFNWSPAKVFMGDVGSAFLGAFFAALVILSQQQVGTVYPFLIIHLLFIVDATYTLVVRYRSGVKVSQAHRDHAYQHATQMGYSHKRVVILGSLINIAWLLPLAYLSRIYVNYGAVILLIAALPLTYTAFKLRAGKPLRNT